MDTNSLKVCSPSLCAHALVDGSTSTQLLTKIERKKRKKRERKQKERKKEGGVGGFLWVLRVVGGVGVRYHQNILYVYKYI